MSIIYEINAHNYKKIVNIMNSGFIVDNHHITMLYNSFTSYLYYPSEQYTNGLNILHLFLRNINKINLKEIFDYIKKHNNKTGDYLEQFVEMIFNFAIDQINMEIIISLVKANIYIKDLDRFSLNYGKELYDKCFIYGYCLHYLERFTHVPRNVIIMRELPRINIHTIDLLKGTNIKTTGGTCSYNQAEKFICNNNLAYDGYYLQNYYRFYKKYHHTRDIFTPYDIYNNTVTTVINWTRITTYIDFDYLDKYYIDF